jgi:hypothetical protein
MSMLTKVSRRAPLTAAPLALLVVSAAWIGACSRDADAPGPGAERAAAQAASRAKPAKAPRDDLVTAPTSARAEGPVTLKFALSQKPAVGKPVDIEFALVPVAGLDRVVARFQAGEGLEMRGGAQTPAYEKPEAGAQIAHTVTVVPSRDGIFYVSAVVLADSETSSIARTYSIPIIAGEGLSALPVAAKPATQPIASAPAANSRQSQ